MTIPEYEEGKDLSIMHQTTTATQVHLFARTGISAQQLGEALNHSGGKLQSFPCARPDN